MSNKTGGAAFPLSTVRLSGSVDKQEGMTLRDYMAGQALITLMVRLDMQEATLPGDISVIQHIANTAYDYADAMIAARSDKP